MRSGIVLGLLLGAGCAAASPHGPHGSIRARARPPVIAVLPASWLTTPPDRPIAVERAVVNGLVSSRARVTLRTGAPVARALETIERRRRHPGCLDDLRCVREVGRALGADKALLLRLGALGRTVVVRVALVDIRAAAQEQSRQQVVRSEESRRVEAAVRRLAGEIGAAFAPRPEPERRWYEHWAVWTGVGATVVLAAGTTAWLATRPDETPFDDTITPPPQP